MTENFRSLSKLVNLRGKTINNGWYKVVDIAEKTEIAIHHSLTKTGNSAAFARYHVTTNGWPEVAYHFVILKDGTVEWNHQLGVVSYHVGNSNKFAVGICVVGDFRTEEPTPQQKESLFKLHELVKNALPNYKRTRGHNEYPGYATKQCPVFDYNAIISQKKTEAIEVVKPENVADNYAKEAQAFVIEKGISDGTAPRREITRQEVWTMLHRALTKGDK